MTRLKLVRTLSIVSLIVAISVPSVLAGFQAVDLGRHYGLSLAATRRFSTIILTAHLTVTEDHHRKEDVAGALIRFYTCNRFGCILREIGHSITKRDGTARFEWSAPKNGDYWFVASCTVKTDAGHSLTMRDGR